MSFHRLPLKASLAMLAAGVMLIAQLAPTYAASPVSAVSSGTPEVDQSQSPTGAKNGHPAKIVFHRTKNQAGLATSGGNLSYHGGPTERQTSVSYAIFWQPTGSYMSPTYQSLIDRYFGDIGGSGLYNNDTQYSDSSGNIVNSSGLGGTWADSSPYPSGTLGDTDIQNEVINAVNANGWNWTNADAEFFVFTAKGENSCLGSSCSFTQYCAYHSNVTLTNGVTTTPVRYANMPYTGTNLAACGVSTSPNNDVDADSTISVTSHEHMETVTDPLGNAWYDATGSEIGDKCAWNFGGVNLDGNQANEEWNGHFYIVQQEWSNASSGCVLTYGANTAPSYSIAASPASLTAVAGGAEVKSNLTLTSTGGFSSAGVNLSVASSPTLPAGSTLAVITPVAVSGTAAGSSTLSVQVPAGATAGSYTLTVTGDGATPAPTTNVSLSVSVPTYSIAAAAGSITVQSGTSGTDGLTLTSSNGFSSSGVNLTLTSSPALPAGATATATSPVAVSPTAPGSSTLTVQVPAGTPTASYTLTITGDGATPTPKTTVTLNIAGPTPTFSMSASPSSLTVARGASGSDTVTLTSANGYNSSVSLSASGLPGRTTVSFSPNPVTPTSAGATSTMKITTNRKTPLGTYNVTVTGRGSNSTTQSTTLSLTVQ